MKNACSIAGCPGHYEARKVTHTTRHRGEVVVIDDVPAEVCDICGDVLFKASTVDKLQALLAKRPATKRSAPLYSFKKAS